MSKDKILNPNCSELVVRCIPIESKEELIKELEKIGIYKLTMKSNEWYEWDISDDADDLDLFLDIDNPNQPDFENHSSFNIYKDEESDGYESDGMRITAYQHCQHQLFPTLKKIIDNIGGELEGYDGGSTYDYEDWESKGYKKIPDYQSDKNKRKRINMMIKLGLIDKDDGMVDLL